MVFEANGLDEITQEGYIKVRAGDHTLTGEKERTSKSVK